jgi:hypothetical protein
LLAEFQAVPDGRQISVNLAGSSAGEVCVLSVCVLRRTVINASSSPPERA